MGSCRHLQSVTVAAIAVGVLTPAFGARAEDYPQWRGPQRTGISRETGLLKRWPKEGPKLLWQVNDVGYGFGSPSIARGRIYLVCSRGSEEYVQARDVKDGHRLWSTPLGKVGNPDLQPTPGARATPTVDGDRLYVLGSDGDLLCLEAPTGKVVWRKSLQRDFGGQPGGNAYVESPLIDGNLLICTPGGSQATLAALDKMTGDLVWKCVVPGANQAGYSSAIIATLGGVRQYVQFVQRGVVGIDAKSGRFLWSYDGTSFQNNINTPVAQDGCVYTSTLTAGGLAAITAQGDAFEAREVYQSKRLTNNHNGVVLIGDYLYGTGGPCQQCVDLHTGEVKWRERSVGAGSSVFADGRLYIYGENGEMVLVEASPMEYRERGRFMPPGSPSSPGVMAWTYPVIANGRLYVRHLGTLWCYDVRAARGAR
ncbi:MAG TPA: PQQ-binding-like beta-propeller repeat protein [Armatimonadota bacterium]|jgi:outer membrane protein assembly factor BamB